MGGDYDAHGGCPAERRPEAVSDTVGERLARLEALMAEHRDDLRDLKKMVGRTLDDHEQRLRTIEGWRAHVVGVAAAVGTAASLLGRAIIDWLRGQ